PEELHHRLRPQIRTAFGDGVWLPIEGEGQAKMRVQLELTAVEEVHDYPRQASETVVNGLPQGGQSAGASVAHVRNPSGGIDLAPVVQVLHDGSVIKWVGKILTPRAEVVWTRQALRSSSEVNHVRYGGVENDRGEPVLFKAKATWKVELTTADGRVRTERVEVSSGNDSDSLFAWLSNAYAEGRPEHIAQLPPAER